MRTVVPFALLTAFAVAVVAAPVPKEKSENLGPITDEQLAESKNNMKQIGLAMHNYESAMGEFPNNIADKKGKLLLSWRVAILPYIEQDHIYKQFNLDEPWDSDTNKKLIEQMPKLYAPIRAKPKEKGVTFYRGFTGAGTVFEAGKRVRITDLTDGTSNTIMVAEADEPCVWTKPDDLPIDAKKDLPKFGGLFDGEFHVLFGDGTVKRAKAKVEADVMRAIITRNGGEVFTSDGLFDK
jgi:Protein of unknown function (DUF1559)